MKIAVVGSGVSGLMAARQLHELGHELTVFEKDDQIGGHVRTARVPVELPNGETELFPVEHGVFMHDPQMIHPLMNEYIKQWDINIRTFPLTFSYQNEKSNFSWTTNTGTTKTLRELAILFETAYQSLPQHTLINNISYLREIRRFIHQWQELSESPRYRHTTVDEFMYAENYSDRFRNEWLLPQVHCWWGVPDHLLGGINIQTIADPMLKVSMCPQYIFIDGWSTFTEKIAEPINGRIRLSTPASKVSLTADGVAIATPKGAEQVFDHVIMATPPSVCADIIEGADSGDYALLRSFVTTETEIFLHTDPRWMPEEEKWSTANLIQDSKGKFCTLWFGELHPQKPPVFVTWGAPLEQAIDPDKIIDSVKMLRTLPTTNYVESCRKIKDIQGKRNLWYCGAHVDALATGEHYCPPSLWHENAFRSGLNVAESVHGKRTEEPLP